MFEKAMNYYLLISRMGIKQIYYRLIKIIKFQYIYKAWGHKLHPLTPIKFDNNNYRTSFFQWKEYDKLLKDDEYKKDIISIANDIVCLKFNFLNISQKFKQEEFNWKVQNQDKLWNYYLHYFEYLVELIEAYHFTNDVHYINKAQSLIDDWITNTSPGDENSWEAYTISIRLVNWSHLWDVIENNEIEIYPGFKKRMISSIHQQVKFLKSNLEKDLANNHLTANGKALFWVGVNFPGFDISQRLIQSGIKILHKQLKKEVRRDGSQYENSTSYQLMTTKDYLEVLILADKNNVLLPEDFYNYTEKMFEYTLCLIKPDGTLPLLNDSIKDYPINVGKLMAVGCVYFNRGDFKLYSNNRLSFMLKIFGKAGFRKFNTTSTVTPNYNSKFLTGSKYCVMKTGWKNTDSYFLFDAGNIGPKHNSGHAHADNLSIYLYVNNECIFTDPGTFEYEAGLRREYYRSTRAHNTIEVEGNNQTTFWGPFRTGHIANSKLISVEKDDTKFCVSAMHDGYKRLKQKVTHIREVRWNYSNCWEITDKIEGRNTASFNVIFNIGKSCKDIKVYKNKCLLSFKNSNVTLEIKSKSDFEIIVGKGWVSEGWKEEFTSKKINISFKSSIMPTLIKTKINVSKK